MAPTFEAARAGYAAMWARARIKDDRVAAARKLAERIIANRTKYTAVERATGVPWFMLAAIHNRESSLNFNGVLHNGQEIIGTGQKTTIVPKGRGPFNTWSEAAIDALTVPPHNLTGIKYWSIERILYETERWNGWGYMGRVNSPYLWSWTSEYHGGKYVRDGVYDPNAWDSQAGCVAVLKALAALDASVADRIGSPAPLPPDVPIPKPKPPVPQPTKEGAIAALLAALGAVVAAIAAWFFDHWLPLLLFAIMGVAGTLTVRHIKRNRE